MRDAANSKSAVKKKSKTAEGLELAWKEASNSVKILKKDGSRIFVTPLNYKGAKFMRDVYDISARWCISTDNSGYWDEYIQNGSMFIMFYSADNRNKLMIQIEEYVEGFDNDNWRQITVWDPDDEIAQEFLIPGDYHEYMNIDGYGVMAPENVDGIFWIKNTLCLDMKEFYDLLNQTMMLYEEHRDDMTEDFNIDEVLRIADWELNAVAGDILAKYKDNPLVQEGYTKELVNFIWPLAYSEIISRISNSGETAIYKYRNNPRGLMNKLKEFPEFAEKLQVYFCQALRDEFNEEEG